MFTAQSMMVHVLALCCWAALAAAAPPAGLLSVTPKARSLLEMDFETLPFPKGIAQHQVATSEAAVVDGEDYTISYKLLARGGTPFGSHVFGRILDSKMEPVMIDGNEWISDGADFNSLLPIDGKLFMITHWENPNPSMSYFSELEQNLETGELTIITTEPMDWSQYEGLWTPCAGSVTPWKTHLGSEEYEPDARTVTDNAEASPEGMEWKEQRYGAYVLYYFGLPENTTNAEVLDVFHPYLYGYPWEAVVNGDGLQSTVKHFSMGRLAYELPYVMPDLQTVYLTDDGTNRMFGIFRAAEPGNLTCGELFGAKFTQATADEGGVFNIEWLKVGERACDDTFEAVARDTLFTDLFETAEPEGDGCPGDFTSVNVGDALHECLKVKPGQELLASRLEFRRYAAMLGVTTEFSKLEGITYDSVRRVLYASMSDVREGMEDMMKKGEPAPEFDVGGNNHIRVDYNECGCVYALQMPEDSFMANAMEALICGSTANNTDEFNSCDKDGIANPDNIAYVAHHDGLIIGEDSSGGHRNDVMWHYDIATSELTRILSTPYGSETTSPFWYPNINGWAYIMAVVQHPYGESDEHKVSEVNATGVHAWVGYIGPFRAHPESINMAEAEAPAGTIWNGWEVELGSGAAPLHIALVLVICMIAIMW